jgi:ferredoxin
MKANIDEACIGCGTCPAICPEVFSLNGEGLASAPSGQIPEKMTALAVEAAESCPVNAIHLDQ